MVEVGMAKRMRGDRGARRASNRNELGNPRKPLEHIKPWAGPVTITRADGSTEVRKANNRNARGGRAKRPRKDGRRA